MIDIQIKTFDELSKQELYRILQLRSEVFVDEQDCVYQDIDGKNEKALHVIGVKENIINAHKRLFKPGDYYENASIGRVVVAKHQRQYKYGHDIMKASIQGIKRHDQESFIKI